MPYSLTQIASIALLIGLFVVQHRYPHLLKMPRRIFCAILLVILSSLSTTTYLQWALFSATEPSKFLLPPYAPWDYFIGRSWSWIWSPYLLALGGAALLALCIGLAPQSWKELRFSEGEPLIIIAGLFLVGHPYWIFYGAGVLLLYCIYAILRGWRAPGSERVSFYPWWIPAALLVVLLTPILRQIPFMQMLSITLT